MSREEFDSNSQCIGERKVPLSCPNCTNTLSLEGYDAQLKVLKPRYWHVCNQCGFDRSLDDFKRELFSV